MFVNYIIKYYEDVHQLNVMFSIEKLMFCLIYKIYLSGIVALKTDIICLF